MELKLLHSVEVALRGATNSLAILAIGELAMAQVEISGYDADAAHGYLVTGVFLNLTLAKVRYDAAERVPSAACS